MRKWRATDRLLATALVDRKNKMSTGGSKIGVEMEDIYRRYVRNEAIPLATIYRKMIYPLDRWRARKPGLARMTMVRAVKTLFRTGLAPFYGYDRTRAINWSAYV